MEHGFWIPRSKSVLLASVLVSGLMVGGQAAWAQEGGIEVFAGSTLFEGGTRVSLTHIYKRKATLYDGSTRIRDPLDRTMEDHRIVAGVDHGLRPDLTLSALIPYVYRQLRTRTPGGRDVVDASGLGDVALIGKYRLWKQDWKRSSFNISAIGGLELPTGKTDEKDDGVRLPPSLQPGSGSWDPFLATGANLSLDRFRFDALVFYKWNTPGAQDHDAGDFFVTEADVAYRFIYTDYPGPTASARAGLQWRVEGRAGQDGRSVNDSGSEELRLRLGLGFHPVPNVDLSVSVDLPLYQWYRGTQLGLDVRTFLGFGIRF